MCRIYQYIVSCLVFQEVVSARIDGEAGDMSVLGHAQHKMIVQPDFEAMLSAMLSAHRR